MTSRNYTIKRKERYTLQERIQIFNIHYKNDENLAETIRKTGTTRVIVEKPLYPQRVTVWSGLWSGGVIGPYFLENEMINDFLWPKLDVIDLDRLP